MLLYNRYIDVYLDIVLGYVNGIYIVDGGIYIDGVKVLIIRIINIFGKKKKYVKV